MNFTSAISEASNTGGAMYAATAATCMSGLKGRVAILAARFIEADLQVGVTAI
jgi:hypothetical protein